MSYDYSVHGVFVFATSDACAGAIRSARELLGDDTGFGVLAARSWDAWFRPDGPSLVVDIELSGPGDWWVALEGLIEDVCDEAAEGFVDARHEAAPGLVTRYFAGGHEDEDEDEHDA
ncbi:MAG: hypothetical protein EP329_04195 [Deltaproteobacteria bacterium]|nr:MAG: hypothetical protein EP329_04195 [Deltaproteobacteria bacterium]